MYKKIFILYTLLLLIFSSCEKKDKAVVLPPPGPSKVSEIELGSSYENQVYYDIDSNKTFSSKNRSWELAFESNDHGWHIKLNGGLLVKAINTNCRNWDTTYTKNYLFLSDANNGDLDSTAIGEWGFRGPPFPMVLKGKGYIYIIDRGDTRAAKERYKKFQIHFVDDRRYKIKYANLDGSDLDSAIIMKNDSKNFVYFNFENGGTYLSEIEPTRNKWDILFTSYAQIYHEYNPPLSYIVRGVLLNPNVVCCAKDSTTGYENLNLSFVKTLKYYKQDDVIGYDWKTYSQTSSKYVTRSHVTYIIKSKKGYYYKLRFIDYYNNKGEKGYPKFEFQRL